MQFKHPDLLWALLLLLIPIIVHLFQLRRFEKVAFTNVKFLKKVKLQTRKSSQIKKWLTLLSRLLALACLVLAFAQPFTTNSDTFKAKNETVIYLDNSYSMQAKGSNGSLLNGVIQDILKSYTDTDEVTIFTNDNVFRSSNLKTTANHLITLKHSTNQLSYNSAYLKGQQYFSKDKTSVKNLILVSDFQQKDTPLEFENDSTINLKLVQPKPISNTNVSIDSVYISKYNNDTIELGVDLSNTGASLSNISVALNNNDELVAKTAVDINDKVSTTFTIPNNIEFNGSLSIVDASLSYDNNFYFNINRSDKIKVLTINESSSDDFLRKLYTNDEFIYTAFKLNNLDYSNIENQNVIILNELNVIPNALKTTLQSFKNDGGSILIIASKESDLNSYNKTLSDLNLPRITRSLDTEKRITNINYDHPLIDNAFYNRVSNFQYPKVNSSHDLSNNSNAIYKYDNGKAFLSGIDKTYIFAAALNTDNSNFKKSPLIVPVLYNIGKMSLEIPKLYYTIGEENDIDIDVKLGQDQILKLENKTESVIPLQQTYSKKVSLTTTDFPENAGILDVKNKDVILKKLSFNHKRDESNLVYYTISDTSNYSFSNSLSSTIDTIKSNASINALWKWFVIFALVFLLIEMLLLKYLK